MALPAIENVGDAFSVTRNFLFPFELRRWLKLAVVVLFLGGGVSAPTAQFDVPRTADPSVGTELPTVPFETMTVVVALVGGLVLLGGLFALIGAILEFVFVESLRTGEISIRRHWSRRWRQGLRLFGFRIAIGLFALAVFAGWILLLFAPVLSATVDPIVPFVTLLFVGLPIVFLVGVLYALVASFTTAFVVPIMIQTDGGVLSAWGVLWSSITAHPKQYLAYVVIGFLLTVAAGIAGSLVVGIVALMGLLPLALLGAIMYFTATLSSTAGLVALAGVGLLIAAVVFVFWAVIQVPIVAYLRYYALLVLGDIDESLDLIPEQRATVRTEELRGSDAF